jgi:hypothetical protein
MMAACPLQLSGTCESAWDQLGGWEEFELQAGLDVRNRGPVPCDGRREEAYAVHRVLVGLDVRNHAPGPCDDRREEPYVGPRVAACACPREVACADPRVVAYGGRVHPREEVVEVDPGHSGRCHGYFVAARMRCADHPYDECEELHHGSHGDDSHNLNNSQGVSSDASWSGYRDVDWAHPLFLRPC